MPDARDLSSLLDLVEERCSDPVVRDAIAELRGRGDLVVDRNDLRLALGHGPSAMAGDRFAALDRLQELLDR